MNEAFFFNDPAVLFNNPTKTDDSYSGKINGIARIVIILSVLGYILTFSLKYILIGLITLIGLIILYNSRKKGIEGMENIKKLKRGDVNSMLHNNIPEDIIPREKIKLDEVSFKTLMKNDFYPVTSRNPMGNVLLTDYEDNPNKKPAQPSFNTHVSEEITKNIKKTVQELNPTITNTSQQLYGDLWDKYELDQSNRTFYSNANTKIVNDQGAFVKFLYGDLPSGKDGSKSQLLANSHRYLLLG
jgi:hypothetical protein